MALNEKGQSLLGWIISFVILGTAALVLRGWAAVVQGRRFFVDDALVLIAFASTMTLEGLAIWGIANGMGKHTAELTPAEIKVQLQTVFGSSIAWTMGTVTVKLSVLWLYTRIFNTRSFRMWARGLMVVSVCFGITFMAIFISHCAPVDQLWNPAPGGKCRDIYHEELTSGSLNIVIDTAIIILPMPWLWKLQMSLRNKIFLTVMFTLGSLTLAVMCVRLYETIHPSPDPLVAIVDVGLLSSLELWLGIIVACMPTMAPLFMAYVKPALSKLSGRTRSGRQGRQEMRKVNTIGGSGPSGGSHRFGSNYRELDSSFSNMDKELIERPLAAHHEARVETLCEHTHNHSPPSREGIFVRQEFHTQDV